MAFSVSAWPSPLAIEPCTWPSTNDRVEHVAAIIDRGIGHEVESAGVGIDLDLGDMAAVRKSQRRLGLVLGVEIFADSLGASRCLEQRNLAVGADHFEIAVAILNVGLGGFQQRDANFLPFASITSAV